MRRVVATAAIVALLGGGCAGSSSASRTVRVDFQHDEFASFYWRFFPARIEAHPGDTVVFDQQWTGEPHTVTFGRRLDALGEQLDALEARYSDRPDTPEAIEEGTREYLRITRGVVFDPYLDTASPLAALPCYLGRGEPPRDPDRACSQRSQPPFDGRQSYYSSGFIPPDGPTGNTYRVPLADDIEPGTYRFYCVIHFPDMQGELVVRPTDAELPSESAVNARARREIEKLARPLRTAYAEARSGRAESGSERLRPPIAGYHSGENFTVQVVEFIPRTITTRVGDAVTWTITGAHTVSFGVPRYIPIYFVDDDGEVRRNPQVDRPAGGSPDPPPPDFTKGPHRIDGRTYDGTGFFSSGLLASEPYATYTLRFSKRGRYRYACLIHPKMVGTVDVDE